MQAIKQFDTLVKHNTGYGIAGFNIGYKKCKECRKINHKHSKCLKYKFNSD